MALDPTVQLLKRLKIMLIDILSADPDFVLQLADSRSLLSPWMYKKVKALNNPTEKVSNLLDHIIQRGPEAALDLLKLLEGKRLQETFPELQSIKNLQTTTDVSGKESSRKRKSPFKSEESNTRKKICTRDYPVLNEKQLMTVARAIGKPWREIGRVALEISSVRLEQIEEDHNCHVERVFAMLRYWCNSKRREATAAHLHSLLSQGDWALPCESIDFLLETN